MTSPVTFTGPVTVNITVDVPVLATAVAGLLQPSLDALGGLMTQSFSTVDEALAALGTKVDTLTADEAADRSAFDALAAAVRAFLDNLPPAGGQLTPEQSQQAQTLLDHLNVADDNLNQQASDETALQSEVPTTNA